MEYLNKPVAYLVDSDFDSNGNLSNPEIPKNKPVLLMIQAAFCGHCTTAKPAYQEFANKNGGKVFVATIQADGKEKGEEDGIGKRIEKLDPSFQGFPHYMLYWKGKRYSHDGGRSVADLEQFVKSHS